MSEHLNIEIDLPEDIYYLVHMTKSKFENVDVKNNWSYLRNKTFDTETSKNSPFLEYPGVYFSLITKYNRVTENLFPGRVCLIFSRKLLKQLNYHINISDDNGFITETNTYYPWNIEDAVKKIKENSEKKSEDNTWEENINYFSNEVIFHDPIPMEYCCMDINLSIENIINSTLENNSFLPDFPVENNIEPNMNLLPFYCYISNDEDTRFPSSENFIKFMGDFCKVNTELPKEEIIKEIQNKIPYLYENRKEQSVEIVKSNFDKKKEYKAGKKKTNSKKKHRKIKKTTKKSAKKLLKKNYKKSEKKQKKLN